MSLIISHIYELYINVNTQTLALNVFVNLELERSLLRNVAVNRHIDGPSDFRI